MLPDPRHRGKLCEDRNGYAPQEIFQTAKLRRGCPDVPRDQVKCGPIARLSLFYNKFCLQRDRVNDRRGARCCPQTGATVKALWHPDQLGFVGLGRISPSSRRLAWRPRPIIRWSYTVIPSGAAILMMSFVTLMSKPDGVGSPEG